MPGPTIYTPPPFERYFAFGPDPNSAGGGSNLETILSDTADFPGGVIPDITSVWPVTSAGPPAWTPTRISRANEVLSQRAARPDIPFKVSPVIPWTVAAYRYTVEKALKYVMGAEAISGSGPYVHTLSALPLGSTQLPSALVQLIADSAHFKASGVVLESVDLTFPFDGEGTVQIESHPLYMTLPTTAAPSGVAIEPTALPMVIRDAFVVFDAAGSQVATPGVPTLTPSGTGGTLPAGTTYNYRITATNAQGETLPGPEAVANATTTGSTSTIAIAWAAVPGATGYKVYGRTAGGEQMLATTVTNSYTDTGSPAPSGLMPVVNTTAGGTIPISVSQFSYGFKNNGNYDRQIAGRCVASNTVGANPISRQLWFPYYHKVSARQTVTWGLNFLDTQQAQEVASEWGQIQKIVVTIGEPNVAANQIVFTLFATEIESGGVSALQATGDQTQSFTGNAFYSQSDGTDVNVAVTNANAVAIT